MAVSIKDEAPGWLEEVQAWLEDNSPEKIGFTVPIIGTDVFMHRQWVRIDDATIDLDTGDTSISGGIKYKTGPDAAITAQATVDCEVEYNVKTKELSKAVLIKHVSEFDDDIRINIKAIKDVLEGNWSAALELIPNGGIVKRIITSEYDDRKKWYQDTYGPQNIYFASSDFVRWASPVTAGKYIVALIATGGSASPAIIAEVKAQVRKELAHVFAWMQSVLIANAETVANDFVEGKPISVPQLKLVWQKVAYESTVEVAGEPLLQSPKVNHAAFVLILETGGHPPANFDSQTDRTIVDDSEPRPKWRIGARWALGPTGSRITFLKAGGPAELGGVKLNDVVLKADGESMSVADNSTDLLMRALSVSPDQVIDIEILRDQTTKSLAITLDPII